MYASLVLQTDDLGSSLENLLNVPYLINRRASQKARFLEIKEGIQGKIFSISIDFRGEIWYIVGGIVYPI